MEGDNEELSVVAELTAAEKLAMTLQSAMTALVVNVVPAREPPHVPATVARKPLFGVTVNVVVAFCAIDCTLAGEMVPLEPALGVTLKTAVQDVAPELKEFVPAGHTVWLVAPTVGTKNPGCAKPHEDRKSVV